MRRLCLMAATVFAVACGTPPTGVETELVGGDASLTARKGPTSSARQPKGPKSDEQEDVVICLQGATDSQCPDRPYWGPIAYPQ
jgi:hypothetical protein